MSDVRGKSATAMSRTKKPSKLSADERAFLNRIRSLNGEETGKLTFEELSAYFNIMNKIDPRSVRHAFEETFIDRGNHRHRALHPPVCRAPKDQAGRPGRTSAPNSPHIVQTIRGHKGSQRGNLVTQPSEPRSPNPTRYEIACLRRALRLDLT